MIVEELDGVLRITLDGGSFAAGEHALDKLKKHAEDTGVDKLKDAVHDLAKEWLAFESIKMVAEWTMEAVEATVKVGIEAKHMGERIGMTAQAVQELGYAASLSGASAEDMQISLQHLARGLQEVKKGSGPAADAFKALGLSSQDARVKSGDMEGLLASLADRFSALPDGAKKTALAMEIFGKSGTTLIPLLNKGSAGIGELRAEAEKLGVVLDEDAIEQTEEYERSNKKLHATLTGLKQQAVVTLLPYLAEAADKIQHWVAANKDLIATKIKEFIEGAVEKTIAFVHALSDIATWVEQNQTVVAVGLAAMFAPLMPIAATFAAIIAAYYKLKEIKNAEDDKESEDDTYDTFIKPTLVDRTSTEDQAVARAKRIKSAKNFDQLAPEDQATAREHNASTLGFVNTQDAFVALQKAADSYLRSEAGPAAVSTGPINVTVNATGTDPQGVVDLARKTAEDVQKDALRAAQAAINGGKK